jgi:hypothetical protein
MPKYTYTETVRFVVEVTAVSKEQAEHLASEFIETVLDNCGSAYELHHKTSKTKTGVLDYNLETKDYSITNN